jgi:outer membrane protein
MADDGEGPAPLNFLIRTHATANVGFVAAEECGKTYLWSKSEPVKNLSFILNIVLLVAVLFLYVKVYSLEEEPAVQFSGEAKSSRVVFVNSDSLMDNYRLFSDLQKQMEKKSDSLDAVLNSRGQALEKEVMEYQERAAGMSAGERQLREESLMRKQQALLDQRETLLKSMKAEEDALTDSIYNDLQAFLRKFNEKRKYDFILGYSRGGGIMLANDSLEITRQVIEGLNKRN